MSSFPRRIPVEPTSSTHVDHVDPLVIDCDTCVMQQSDACADCVVSFLLDRETAESTAVVLDLNEIRALKALGDAGLVPTLRHRASG
ncbi:unannotated protein [freshwater metagenome]|uniref:Unannotated protein n=1 Tax=freshwater metagenome TaxID=449393 RepID=A0A6J6EWW7_9ZZZZ